MNIDSFLAKHSLSENPFAAEEASLDPVFHRLRDHEAEHPDFPKIMGQIDQPSTAVVFGEKGSGKTAIRLLIENRVAQHNEKPDTRPVKLVSYDDLNPVLDSLMRVRGQDPDTTINSVRLVDHQDAILSLATTSLIDDILSAPSDHPRYARKPIRRLPAQIRKDLLLLAMLYDRSSSGGRMDRFTALRKKLGLGWRPPLSAARWSATIMTVGGGVAWLARWIMAYDNRPIWLLPLAVVVTAAAAGLWGYWLWQAIGAWVKAGRLSREMAAIERDRSELATILTGWARADLSGQPMPQATRDGTPQGDARYQLTRRLIAALEKLGFAGLMVLVDRVDEPTAIAGQADRMKAVIWPMFDNKFLQQKGVGIKLLLPLELRHQLHRESARFFQEARLDKQNLIDPLAWSGASLYDLCVTRLNACRAAGADGSDRPMDLTDLFAEDVSRDLIVDALDQMHQPRDAFKFLYAVIQEHCRMSPGESAGPRIARLTLETVRRNQAQRVQELYRGLSPA